MSARKTNGVRVLCTNDDGFDAPGMTAMAQALHAAGFDVRVAGPATNQSGVGHGLTIFRTIAVDMVDVPGLEDVGKVAKVGGTPADACKLGLEVFSDAWSADVVVSGINKGANCGHGVHASGTFGAAAEACIQGLQAIAVSLDCHHSADVQVADFAAAAQLVVGLVAQLKDAPLPADVMANVNVPAGDIRGMRRCRHGGARYVDAFRELPRAESQAANRRVYQLEGHQVPSAVDDERDDFRAMKNGYATVVFVRLARDVVTPDSVVEETPAWAGLE